MTWVRIPPGAAHFSLKRRGSEPSQLVVLCCLALVDTSQLHNHVHTRYEQTILAALDRMAALHSRDVLIA